MHSPSTLLVLIIPLVGARRPLDIFGYRTLDFYQTNFGQRCREFVDIADYLGAGPRLNQIWSEQKQIQEVNQRVLCEPPFAQLVYICVAHGEELRKAFDCVIQSLEKPHKCCDALIFIPPPTTTTTAP